MRYRRKNNKAPYRNYLAVMEPYQLEDELVRLKEALEDSYWNQGSVDSVKGIYMREMLLKKIRQVKKQIGIEDDAV